MKKTSPFIFAFIFAFICCTVITMILTGTCALCNATEFNTSDDVVTIYAGTFASSTGNPDIAPSVGIYSMKLNRTNGTLENCGLAASAKSPSWIVKHPALDVYYTVAENEDGKSHENLIIALKKESDGTLVRMNTCNSGGTCACHLSVHPNGKFLCVANYCSGQVAFIELATDGALGKLNTVFTLDGSGPNLARQRRSCAHCVVTDRAGKFTLCCDLGGDQIFSYFYDANENIWKANPDFPVTHTASGAGPRHLVFAPNGKYVYVLNELSCTLDAFAYDSETGKLTLVTSSATLPPGYIGSNKAAAIDIHPSGKFLYVSNRGANLITVFSVLETPVDGAKMEAGTVVSPIQYISTEGEFPRFAGLDPTGKVFLACNKKTHNVTVYLVDQKTGKLSPSGSVQIAWCTGIAY